MEKYLKFLFKLKIFMIDLENLMKSNIDVNSPKEYYIINKDIISRHMETMLYNKVQMFIENIDINSNNNIEELVKQFMKTDDTKNDTIVKDEGIKPTFFNPEILKIKMYEYYNNFFILEEGIYDYPLIGVNKNKTFIGKEGIFIENHFKIDEEDRLYVYFIHSINELTLDEFRLNKIYIFKNENIFLNEFNDYMKGKKPETYFARRNFFTQSGIFNLMDEGKKIGSYISINRLEKYEDNENEKDENREYVEKFLK